LLVFLKKRGKKEFSYCIASLWASRLWIDLTALLLSGRIGVGLGFGRQKVVSHLVSGIIILIDKSIKAGMNQPWRYLWGDPETLGAPMPLDNGTARILDPERKT